MKNVVGSNSQISFVQEPSIVQACLQSILEKYGWRRKGLWEMKADYWLGKNRPIGEVWWCSYQWSWGLLHHVKTFPKSKRSAFHSKLRKTYVSSPFSLLVQIRSIKRLPNLLLKNCSFEVLFVVKETFEGEGTMVEGEQRALNHPPTPTRRWIRKLRHFEPPTPTRRRIRVLGNLDAPTPTRHGISHLYHL